MTFYYRSAPRGLTTDEFIASTHVFEPDELPHQEGFNMKLARVLSKQVLERRFDMEEIKQVAPRANHPLFYDVPCDYGVRIGSQLEKAVLALSMDRDTRRAIIVLLRPDDDPPPCITSVQFFVRDKMLITVAHMRSWDLGLGLAYDVHLFQELGSSVVLSLKDVSHGFVVVMAGSAHLYC